MKVRLTLVAEFEAEPNHYDEFTKEEVLEVEQDNLDKYGVEFYLAVFDHREVTTNLEVIE